MAHNKNYKKSGNQQNRRNDNRRNDNRRNDNRNRHHGNQGGNQHHKKHNQQQQNNQHQQNQQESKPQSAPKPHTTSKAESSNDLLIFIIFLIAMAGAFLANRFYLSKQPNSLYGNLNMPIFKKEGKLTFLNAQTEESIINIDIEIAKSTYGIEKGMTNRRSLPANGGMLYVYDEPNYRTFTMKDVYVGVDILFLDAEKEIYRICKNASPLSKVSIPSGGKAMYVLQVLGGFTDAYQIHIGDHIEFNYR